MKFRYYNIVNTFYTVNSRLSTEFEGTASVDDPRNGSNQDEQRLRHLLTETNLITVSLASYYNLKTLACFHFSYLSWRPQISQKSEHKQSLL